MNTQVNWKKIRNEFQRLADVDKLKREVTRIGAELRKFDFHSVLSPAAASKVRNFEKRYSHLMQTLHQAQRHMDREFTRVLKQIKVHRNDVTKVVTEQKSKLGDLKKRFVRKAATTTHTRTARPAGARRRTKLRRRTKRA